MAGRQSPPRRSPEYVWLITGTLTVMAVVFSVILAVRHDGWYEHWLPAVLILPFFILVGMGLRYVQVRRHGVALGLVEIPMVVAFYFGPAVLVVAVTAVAMLIKEFRLNRHPAPDKLAFNVARAAAGAAT